VPLVTIKDQAGGDNAKTYSTDEGQRKAWTEIEATVTQEQTGWHRRGRGQGKSIRIKQERVIGHSQEDFFIPIEGKDVLQGRQ